MIDNPSARVARLMRPGIAGLSAYHVADATGLIKLDAMENPFPLPADVAAALGAHLGEVALNRYPDGRAERVQAAIRTCFDVPATQDVLLGNGSDELLLLIQMVFGGPGRTLVAPTPTFSMYEVMARMTDTRFVGVPLTHPAFGLDVPAMLAAMEAHEPEIVIIASPNNPTGVAYPLDDLERIIDAAPGLVVIDEAYAPFADYSILPQLDRYPNVLCLRTLSKLGLAGIRLGYAVAAPPWIDALDRARLPYNLNALTQAAAVWLLERYSVLDAQIGQIRAARTDLTKSLSAMSEVQFWPSGTNFLLVRTPLGGDELAVALKTRGILVKSMQRADSALADCIRVTVGTEVENQAFLSALGDALRG